MRCARRHLSRRRRSRWRRRSERRFRARAEAKAQGLLNDLSSRRRVATLFPNSQSMFQGVQERFVNTSAGNLTFLLRDLVAVGAMPIVAGRVYDSALGEGEDFGPGWKLALREEIVRQGDRLAFTDAWNAVTPARSRRRTPRWPTRRR